MKMSRDGLLKDLAEQGKEAKSAIEYRRMENTSSLYEQTYYQALRIAWKNIANGGNMVQELEQIKKAIKTGIPFNHINLLIKAVSTGFTTEWWDVVDDKLIFKKRGV